MNYEMPTHNSPVILKQRALGWWAREVRALPVVPSPRPEAQAEKASVGKTGLLGPSVQPEIRGYAVEGTGQEVNQMTGRGPWPR